MTDVATAYDEEMRALAERLVAFDTTGGNETPAQDFLEERLADLGFDTYRWEADPDALADLPGYPPIEELDLEDRPSVAGVLELGEPDAGPTLVLNGHVDVVPADGEWSGDPFEPRWEGDLLVGRGAVDMKSQLAACVFVARHVAVEGEGDGRIVVESVAGEEEGGFGAATAAHANPYPFERDAVVVAEPTDERLVTATAGSLMFRLRIPGRPAHAARRWQGEDPIDRFAAIREAFLDVEAARSSTVDHPLFERFETPWPVVFGRVEAGTWPSNVPGELIADLRIGVAPGESLAEVEGQFRERLETLAAVDPWLATTPPVLERLGVQFAPASVDRDAPIVDALAGALEAESLESDPVGETYGADSRHYLRAGIPTAVFGPGRIEEAHFPDESIEWPSLLAGADVLARAARTFLSGY